jgi:hypothetical protein
MTGISPRRQSSLGENPECGAAMQGVVIGIRQFRARRLERGGAHMKPVGKTPGARS